MNGFLLQRAVCYLGTGILALTSSMRLSFFFLLSFFILPLQAQVPAELERWVDAQKKLPAMQVAFQLTRALPTLKQPVQSKGKLYRAVDGRFRMEMGEPANTIMLFDGDKMHAWESGKGKWETLSPRSGGMRLWGMFLNGNELSAAEMLKTFQPTVQPQADSVTTLSLVPKSGLMRKHLKQVDLQVQQPSQHLLQLRVLQSDDASVCLAFAPPKELSTEELSKVSFTPSTP
jgi:outer membrane lipoprotein-sorting protein